MRIFFSVILSLYLFHSQAPTKRALIIAVGNYPKESGIAPIASLNDIKYIKAALHKNGFTDNNIDTLKDERATKAGILAALDKLIKNSKRSDIIVVHFSMHGQQIRDQKTIALGKDEEDGYDEALIPYDVKRAQYYPGKYEGENHLRDEEMGAKLTALRNKLGPEGSVLVLIDACHSGTATRSGEFTVSRGEPVPFFDPNNPLEEHISVPEKESFFDKLSDDASNMVVMSGSGPQQQNFQVAVSINDNKEQAGSLSYAFYKAMNELPENSSYQDLFYKMKAFIQSHHPDQVPMAEGNVSQMVFSGQYLPKKETFILTAIVDAGKSTDTLFKIDKGLLDGLAVGSIVHIYDEDMLVTSGIIQRADHFASYGIAQKGLLKGIAYEARPESLVNPAFDISIKIKSAGKDGASKNLASQMQSLLTSYKFLSIADNADMMLEIRPGKNGMMDLHLMDLLDSARCKVSIEKGKTLDEDARQQLLNSIKQFRRIKYLRTLSDGGLLAKSVQVSLLPVSEQPFDGEAVFTQDETFFLVIKNKSREKLFYTVIDISPDNKISVIYPSPSKEAADYFVEKQKTIRRKLGVPANSPTGMEFLKVIVSKEPIDLRAVFEQSTTRAEMNGIQASFDDLLSDDEGSTRGSVSGVKAEEIGIITLAFNIKK